MKDPVSCAHKIMWLHTLCY